MADSFGIPSQFATGSLTRWETTLDDYSSSEFDLLWFFKPTTSANWQDFVTGNPSGNGWESCFEPFDPQTDWSYELKVREKDGHAITDITSGTFTLLVVLSDLEEQINAIQTALINIGKGEKVQSYSIRGRSLSQYGISELTDLYKMLKGELNARDRRRKGGHGILHATFAHR